MKSLFTILIIFISLLGAVSCSPYTLNSSEVYDSTDLSKYKTFNFYPINEAEVPKGMSIYDLKLLQSTIENEMTSRGFKKSENPELMLNIGLYVQQVVETKDALPYGGTMVSPVFYARNAAYLSYYQNTQIISDIYQQGSIVLDIVDAKTDKRVFESIVSTDIDPSMPNMKNPEKVAKGIAVLFKKFPIEKVADKKK